MKRHTSLILLATLALGLNSCQLVQPPPDEPDPGGDNVIQQILGELSIEEKVGQLMYIGVPGRELNADMAIISAIRPGGVILFGRNISTREGTISAINAYYSNSEVPVAPFIGIDQEGGPVSRLPATWATRYPVAAEVGKLTADEARQLARSMGQELSALGINMNFAPVLDINSNPRNPVIGDRSYGSTAAEVWNAGEAVLAGLQDGGVIPVVKHFPGHGDTSTDSHLELPRIDASRDLLEQRELWPFRQAIAADAPAIMLGHLLVPALDALYPASLSSQIVTDLLRNEYGFAGLVITDDLEMKAIAQEDIGSAAVRSILAGADMVLVCHTYAKQQAVFDSLLQAVADGTISMERLDQSVQRVLSLKHAYQILSITSR